MKAVAYYRTSSLSGVGDDKDSLTRQQEAVKRYADANGIEVVNQFYDPAVRGTDHLVDRKEFGNLLTYVCKNGIKVILFETVNRLARDVMVQLTGYQHLKSRGVRLVPVDDSDHFDNIEDNPMAEGIMIIMATMSMIDKKMLCKRMRSGIEKVRRETGRCEGRKPAPPEAIAIAKKLHAEGHSLREISASLASAGFFVMESVFVDDPSSDKPVKKRISSGKPYYPQSIKAMLQNGDRSQIPNEVIITTTGDK